MLAVAHLLKILSYLAIGADAYFSGRAAAICAANHQGFYDTNPIVNQFVHHQPQYALSIVVVSIGTRSLARAAGVKPDVVNSVGLAVSVAGIAQSIRTEHVCH